MREKLRSQRETMVSLPKSWDSWRNRETHGEIVRLMAKPWDSWRNRETHGETVRLDRYESDRDLLNTCVFWISRYSITLSRVLYIHLFYYLLVICWYINFLLYVYLFYLLIKYKYSITLIYNKYSLLWDSFYTSDLTLGDIKHETLWETSS